ncbi:MAG: ribonuclease III [Desulfobacter sp.]|nr:ribonuclease III [Desulfobacter sp.]WDP87320.1 MAG: ribonuclease III [Desulfobacter sp.]
MIDLHIHSTASDGSLTPLQILDLARETGVRAIALTDHDSIAGVKEIAHLVPSYPLEFITGVEISCTPPLEFKFLGSVHMLGYGFSVYDRRLNQVLNQAVKSREQRNPKIIEKLNEIGFDITLAEVEKRFGARQTGRPHIAELLVEKGYVNSFKQAFDLYMGKDKPAYVDKFKISCKEAIGLILDAGGIPVLAHPGLLEFQVSRGLEPFVDMLAAQGLQGIEVFYTDHDAQQIERFAAMARKKNLVATGGSDFHGSFNKGVDLGRGKGDLRVRPSVFKAVTERLTELRYPPRLDLLEKNLQYQFKDISLLSNALCHRSFLNENQSSCESDNERLEFLGDAVLGLCVGQMLMEADPSKPEGELSKLRSNLVSEPGLARMARRIDLGRFIKLGKGEFLSGGGDKNSILSDAFEAVIAAIYLDAGFDKTWVILQDLFGDSVKKMLVFSRTMDHKSCIQEYAQEHYGTVPEYVVEREMGPDHDKTFEICLILGSIKARGKGKTKKAAEQDAARNALAILNPDS